MQAYNRSLLRAAADFVTTNGGSVEALCQNDQTAELDPRYLPPQAGSFRGFGGSRSAFAGAALRAARRRPDWIVLGHAQYLPLAPPLRALARGHLACVLLGIEAWARWRVLQRIGARACTEFLSISDFTRRQTQQANHTERVPTHLLPCSLDPFWTPPDPQQPARPPGTTLLTVARLSATERYKGVDELIRAVPEIRKTSSGVRCRIVGEGSDRSRLEALARELSVADSVSFLGSLGEADLRREYASCDLFVMPSSREGFGIVFLEAASYGKASIGAAAGGTPEVIRDGTTGLLVPPGDPAALAAAIAPLLGNVGRLSAFGEAARADLHQRFVFPSFRKRFADLMLGKVGPGGMNGSPLAPHQQ